VLYWRFYARIVGLATGAGEIKVSVVDVTDGIF
jgi:hypothetical protein